MVGILDLDNSNSMDMFVPSSQLSTRRRSKLICDPIYGLLEVDEHLVDTIDTPHFQRLRDLKQLGMSDRVFPGATHTRFEHSVGVAHLCEKQMSHLYQKQRVELFENEADYHHKKKIVELGGLCHDLGHGPLGHVFDSIFLRYALSEAERETVPAVHHENRSMMLYRDLVDKSYLDMNSQEVDAVCELIGGSGNAFKNEPYMYQIVANEKNSLDVDKYDYIQRDTLSTGVKWGFDPDRLISASRVLNGEMCYHQREVYTIYDMFNTRFKLHKVVYNHRVVKAVEIMAVDALLEANPVLNITESITRPDEFLRMSDYLLWMIGASRDPKLKKSRDILDRIQKRDLYKLVDESIVTQDSPKIKEEDITSCQSGPGTLTPTDLAVYTIRANHGMGPRNPVDNVDFYKTVEDTTMFRVRSEQISYVMPDVFEERIVRVYSKIDGKDDEIKEAFRRCLKLKGITANGRKRPLDVP